MVGKIKKEDYECAICKELVIRPHVTVPCDHLFCEACVPSKLGYDKAMTCPVCRGHVSSVMRSHTTERLLSVVFGNDVVACNRCGKAHSYAETTTCRDNTFVYYADMIRITHFTPQVRSSPILPPSTIIAQTTPSRALAMAINEDMDDLFTCWLERDGREVVALIEGVNATTTLECLKTTTLYLHKLPAAPFRPCEVGRAEGIDFFSTVPVQISNSDIEVVNAYDALIAKPDVFLISASTFNDIMCDYVWKQMEKETTSKKRKLDESTLESN